MTRLAPVASPTAETERDPSPDLSNSSGQPPQDRPELPAIAETLSDPIVGALDGTIHTWNAGAERLFGYRAEEVIGKPVSILYPPDRLGELEEILRCLGRGEAIEQFDTVRRRKDGTDVQVSLSLSPVRTQAGEIVGAAIVHDISDRKRQENFQRFLVEASRLLAVNLDYRETLSRVAHLTLSGLADWCLVEIAGATTARSRKWRSPIAIRSRPSSRGRCGDVTRPMPTARTSRFAYLRPARRSSSPTSRTRC